MPVDDYDDIPRYRKKSTTKTPKKSKHKHQCEPCVLAYPKEWYLKDHLRTPEKTMSIDGYCPICGKIGKLSDKSLWYTKTERYSGFFYFLETTLTNEGEQEMNAETRTLPYFEIDDPLNKFVRLTESEG